MRKKLQVLIHDAKKLIFVCAGMILLSGQAVFGEEVNGTSLEEHPVKTEATDTTAPLVTNVTFGSTTGTRGGSVVLTLDVVETETAVKNVAVYLYSYNEDGRNDLSSEFLTGVEWLSGAHEITIPIPSNAKSGTYYIGQIDVEDNAGNKTQYFEGCPNTGYNTDATGAYVKNIFGEEKCYINAGATLTISKIPGADETNPKVNSIKILNEMANRGGTFDVEFDITEEGSGIDYLNIGFYSIIDGERKSFSSVIRFSGEKTGTYTRSIKVEGVSGGTFYADDISIYDKNGNSTTYFYGIGNNEYKKEGSVSIIPNVMPNGANCTVVDGKTIQIVSDGDVQDPLVDYYRVLTPDVIKPDVAKVEVHVVEEVAIDYILVGVYTSQDGRIIGELRFSSDENKTGNYTVEIPVTTNTPSGEYHVSEITVVDKAGNQSEYFNGCSENNNKTDEKGLYLPGIGNANKRVYISPTESIINVNDEFNPAFELNLSNPTLLSRVQALNEGETGQILIDSTKVVNENIFAAIKGKNVNLAFFTNDYRWVFNGLEINDPKAVELSIRMDLSTQLIDSEEKNVLKVVFAENGVLPGKAHVRVRSDFFKKHQYSGLNLYYWNPEKNVAEFEKDGNVFIKGAGDDFWGQFTVEHNSTFLIADEGSVQNAEAKRKQSENITAFTTRMYTVVLNRNPDPSGLNNWVSGLASGTMDGASLARGFICSKELVERNLSNEAYVDVLYKTFFNREGDPSGKAYWMDYLSQGNSRTKVLAGFVNSVEFGNLCDTYGIARGTLMEDGNNIYNKGVRDFVLRNYSKALGRRGETAGVEDWSYRINTGNMSALDVAMSFFHSEEFLNKNLSNDDYVEVLYETFLGRASDAGGKADWVGQLNGGANRDDVMKGFAYSNEFKEIMSRYGL